MSHNQDPTSVLPDNETDQHYLIPKLPEWLQELNPTHLGSGAFGTVFRIEVTLPGESESTSLAIKVFNEKSPAFLSSEVSTPKGMIEYETLISKLILEAELGEDVHYPNTYSENEVRGGQGLIGNLLRRAKRTDAEVQTLFIDLVENPKELDDVFQEDFPAFVQHLNSILRSLDVRHEAGIPCIDPIGNWVVDEQGRLWSIDLGGYVTEENKPPVDALLGKFTKVHPEWANKLHKNLPDLDIEFAKEIEIYAITAWLFHLLTQKFHFLHFLDKNTVDLKPGAKQEINIINFSMGVGTPMSEEQFGAHLSERFSESVIADDLVIDLYDSFYAILDLKQDQIADVGALSRVVNLINQLPANL